MSRSCSPKNEILNVTDEAKDDPPCPVDDSFMSIRNESVGSKNPNKVIFFLKPSEVSKWLS